MGTKLAAYRNEIARQFGVMDKLEAEVKELRDVEARFRARLAVARAGTVSCHMEHGTCVHAKNAIRLEAALVQMGRERDEAVRERDALKRLLRRYESAAVPGQNGYNEARARARKKLAKRAAEEAGEEYVENHTVGPPENHAGHHCGFDISRVEWREHEKCPKCGGRVKQRKIYTKIIIDFEGDSRFITVALYKGHAARCDTCRRTFRPKFPSIGGTSFGMEVLSFILEYAGRRSTDGDIAYYMERLYRYLCSINSVWNARQAIARVLEPAVERIKEELKKAPFLMLDETTYRYRKKRIYVWVARADTATMVVPAMGRGEIHAPDFLAGLSHIPVVVDGYSVYIGMFRVRQRCWAHILLKAEETYIRCKDEALQKVYWDLYCSLNDMHIKAKRIAGDTAPDGGADADKCLQLERETAAIAAAYGDAPFGVHLSNALPNLFTFLRYPGMPSTNNGSERDLRDTVVKQRKFRYKFASRQEMWVFSMVHSFVHTCHKMGVPPGDTFKRMAMQPGYDPTPYGLCDLPPADPDDTVEPNGGDAAGGTGGADVPKPSADAGQPGSTANTAHAPTVAAGRMPRGVAAKACVLWAYFQAQDMSGADYRMVGVGPPCVSVDVTGQCAAGMMPETSHVMAPCGMPPPANIR